MKSLKEALCVPVNESLLMMLAIGFAAKAALNFASEYRKNKEHSDVDRNKDKNENEKLEQDRELQRLKFESAKADLVAQLEAKKAKREEEYNKLSGLTDKALAGTATDDDLAGLKKTSDENAGSEDDEAKLQELMKKLPPEVVQKHLDNKVKAGGGTPTPAGGAGSKGGGSKGGGAGSKGGGSKGGKEKTSGEGSDEELDSAKDSSGVVWIKRKKKIGDGFTYCRKDDHDTTMSEEEFMELKRQNNESKVDPNQSLKDFIMESLGISFTF